MSMTDWAEQAKKEAEQQATKNAANKEKAFAELAKLEISLVIVEFDGEGDSGQIEGVSAYKGDPETIDHEKDAAVELSNELDTLVEDICYYHLGESYGGWENNDGAHGTFTINVAKKSISLEINHRFTDYNTENVEF